MNNFSNNLNDYALTKSTVFIHGETGTGKEFVADLIVKKYNNGSKNYKKVYLPTINENLIEATLFGYEKGSFTDANTTKEGVFEQANNGVILLDEIGDIPLHIQTKLLRVLENQEITKIGSNTSIKLDIKIIVTTNKNIESLLDEGKFRLDLYHRLKVLEMFLEPIREKKIFLLGLVKKFIKKFSFEFNKNVFDIDSQTENIFLKHNWFGNIRELKNVIEASIIKCKKNIITVSDLPKYLVNNTNLKEEYILINDIDSFESIQKKIFTHYFKKYKSVREVSKVLNIPVRTVYRKYKKYFKD